MVSCPLQHRDHERALRYDHVARVEIRPNSYRGLTNRWPPKTTESAETATESGLPSPRMTPVARKAYEWPLWSTEGVATFCVPLRARSQKHGCWPLGLALGHNKRSSDILAIRRLQSGGR